MNTQENTPDNAINEDLKVAKETNETVETTSKTTTTANTTETQPTKKTAEVPEEEQVVEPVEVNETIETVNTEAIAEGLTSENEVLVKEEEEKQEQVKKPEEVEPVEVDETIETVNTEAIAEGLTSENEVLMKEEEKEGEEKQEQVKEPEDVDYTEMDLDKLLSSFEVLLENHPINIINKHVSYIKLAFIVLNKALLEDCKTAHITEGGTEDNFSSDEVDKQQARFDQIFSVYKKKKEAYQKELELERVENLAAKRNILESLKALIASSESLKSTYDKLRELQTEWRTIGNVPKEETDTLWKNYHFLVEKFFDKVRMSKELKDLDLKKNLESKISLCEKAEELILEKNIQKSFKSLQQYHKEWKELGPIPFDKKDEIWERFRLATETINKRRKEHYEELQVRLEENYKTKLALCEKALEFTKDFSESIKTWNAKTEEINELLTIWKSVGQAPKKLNDEVWLNFKSSLDSFYNAKKAFFAKIKEQQTHNFNLKLDLCTRAEALQDSTEWKTATAELINLNKEWKTIGPVPRKHSDKVWKRFRAACDTFFNTKEAYFGNRSKNEEENLSLRKTLIEEIKNHDFGDDKTENLTKLKEFQRKWIEIGHVPIKEKDTIHHAYRAVIDEKMKTLNISSAEATALQFRNKIEAVKNQPNAQLMLDREASAIQNKISKIKDEVNLWENNMSFFANSKNADLLKIEFEKKIDKAKKEIMILQAKLKMILANN